MYTLLDFQHIKQNNHESSRFLQNIIRKWDKIHEESGVFRYTIYNLQEKIVGPYLLQLNPDRNSKRRYPESIHDIRQPFDKDKFNFTKASPEETIFTFKRHVQDIDTHSVLVNVSPICRYHSLFCPSVNLCLPQVVTQASLELIIDLMYCAGDRAFRIGFNSLCGFASVNHLHYHFFIIKHILPVETAKCDHIKGPVYCLTKEYPIPAFCFEVSGKESSNDISKEIYKLLEYMLDHSIAHNIFVTNGSSCSGNGGESYRVLVWPRKSSSGAKHLKAFNVALCELSGWFPIYDAQAYENLQEADLESELAKWRIDDFENLCKEIKALY